MCINPKKTKFMIMSVGENTNKKVKMKLSTSKGEVIEDVLNMKILGIWLNTKCSMETHITKIKGSVCKQLTSLQPTLKYLNIPTRRELIYSKVGSLILYGAELYSGQVDAIRDKFTALMMRCNRYISQNFVPITRNTQICKEAGVQLPEAIINQRACKMLKKCIVSKKPAKIHKSLKISSLPRQTHLVSFHQTFRTKKGRRNPINRAATLFNTLPPKIRCLPVKLFNKHIVNYSLSNVPHV